MKKNFLLATMALFMTLFASSCSQEEIISDNNSKEGGTVSVAVNIPVNNPVTRAVPNIPEGYKLRCILQLVNSNDNNNITDGRYVQEVAAGSEKVTFTFNAPSGPYKCLFWADYVKEGTTDVATDNIYDTADLKAIGYTTNAGNEMFKGDVADAFYACSPEPVNGSGALTSITMKRPFTKITFKDGQLAYTKYTKIQIIDLPAPTGFNVMSGETAGYTGKGNYESSKISSSELAVENGKWFSAYLFASSNKENLGTGNDIVFKLKNDSETSGELKLNGASITLTENVEVEATVEPQKEGDTSIDVIFPDGMNDATKPKVGQFLYKDGTWGDEFKAENTIGIVFATKNSSITDESNYGDNYTGKEIVGYAMATNSIVDYRSYIGKGSDSDILPTIQKTGDTPFVQGDYNGYNYTSTLLNAYNDDSKSNIISDYNQWKKSNESSATNLSQWYIPSARQLIDCIGSILGFQSDDLTVNKIEAMTTAYQTIGSPLFINGKIANLMSSYIGKDNIMTAVQLEGVVSTENSGTYTANTIKQVFTPASLNGKSYYNIMPILTIFKAE